ncbi:MAG: hypothetical protein AAGA58_05000 [Verrucomicrobiota bacterium]
MKSLMANYKILLLSACLAILPGPATASDFLVYEGTEGPGAGKHIVFIANDHEYRSEETCPTLAKILAKHHGFRCTVLFGIDENGHIQAGSAPVPGLEALKEADLLVFYTRFMNLPDEQADLLVDYFERGGPVVGLRTSTHCFNKQEGKWEKLNFNYNGDDYLGGLGEQIFGNTWNKERGQSHYGSNHRLGGTITPLSAAGDHPVLTGVQPFHTYSGSYKSRPPADATPLLEVQVLNTFGPSKDINTELPAVNAGWTRDHYIAPSGEKKEARVVYTSYGTSEDLFDDGSRRFLVNACFWAAGMEDKISPDLNVDFVGEFSPSPYTTGAFNRVGVKPNDLAGWDSQIMPDDAKMNGLHDPAKGISSRMGRALKPRPELLQELKETYTEFDWEEFQP